MKTLTAEMILMERGRIRRIEQRAIPEERDRGGHENDRRELGHGATGVAAFLKAVDEMNAVVDPDADERHDGKERKQIELDAREREKSRGPHETEDGGHQRVDRQPPFTEGERHQRHDDEAADDEPFQELRQEATAQLAVDERQPGERLRRVHRSTSRSSDATCSGLVGKHTWP